MNHAGSIPGQPHLRMRPAQYAMLAARSVAKTVLRKLNAHVDYDLHLYETMSQLIAWTPDSVVFDVGANDGRTIFRLMRHLPAPRIHAFEPVSNTFDILAERTAALANVQRHKLAMGAEGGLAVMYLNDQASMNSMYPDWGTMHGQSAAQTRAQEEVVVSTVDDFAEAHGVERINLLKIDTEGHDMQVLHGSKEMLAEERIDMIMVEAGFDVPGRQQPSLASLQRYLSGYDVFLYGIYNQCRNCILKSAMPSGAGGDSPAVLVFCDALFVSARSALVGSR